MYVIRRKEDGKFAKGRNRYSNLWVEDMQEARTYTHMGYAESSLRYRGDQGSFDLLKVELKLAESTGVEPDPR